MCKDSFDLVRFRTGLGCGVEPESPESGPEPIVYDRSYGWEPEDMVLEPEDMVVL